MKKVFIFQMLFFCSLAFSSSAQNHIAFESITTAEGLSQNTVRSILQDRNGFIWIGTDDGLNRYDGKKFSVYTHKINDSTSLSDNYVTEIFEDHAGRMWISTRNGLNLFDATANSFIRIPLSDFSKNTYVPIISEDKSGNIWIGTDGSGLMRIHVDTVSYKPVFRVVQYLHHESDSTSIPGNTVFALRTDDLNNLWIGTETGLCMLTAEQLGSLSAACRFRRIRVLHENTVVLNRERISEIINHNHALWIGTLGKNLYCFDYSKGGSGTWKIFEHHVKPNVPDVGPMVSRMLFDRENNLWVSFASEGLEKITFTGDSVSEEFFIHDKSRPNALISNSCLSLMNDRTDMLWIGTLDGISLFNPLKERFNAKTFPVADQETIDFNVQAMCQEHNRFYFFGTCCSGVYIYDALLKKCSRINVLNALEIYSIRKDDRGNFWIGTNNGVAYLKSNQLFPESGMRAVNSNCPATFYKKNPSDPLNSIQSNFVFTLAQDHNNRIWIGTGQGLSSMDMSSGKITQVNLNPKNSSLFAEKIIRGLRVDAANHLWIATDGGLYQYNLSRGSFIRISGGASDSTSLQSTRMVCLHIDFQNNLWVGTSGGGLSRYDASANTFTTYVEKDGLVSNVVESIESDPSGTLWIGTNKGLSKFDVAHKHFTNFNTKDGLVSNQFNEEASMMTADGFIFFGGQYGYNSFHPDSIRLNNTIPVVALTDFKLLDKSLLLDDIQSRTAILSGRPLTFSYRENSFSFEFASLNYISPEKNQYAVMLEGFDKNWVTLGNRNFVSYTNLDPGTYTLRIRAANNDNLWNEAGIRVPFVITPPFFRTWWFRLSLIAAITLLVYVYYREHIRNIENKKEKELALRQTQLKEQFLANMSHEIRTPLNAIMGMTRLLYEKNPKPDQMKYLNAITQSSDHLLVLINDILDFSKIEAGKIELENIPFNIREAINNVHTTLRFKAEEKGLTFSARISPEVPRAVMGDAVRLAQVLINLAGNAIKFTSKGSVMITCSAEETGKDKALLTVQVIDTGIGITDGAIGKIFESFTQENSSVNREYGGTGLGLAISKRLIEMQGGTLSVSSTKGEGSTFTVSVPYQVASEIEEALPVETLEPDIRKKLSDLRILLVDDNHFNQLVAIDTLELELQRTTVDVAENGEEAVRMISENNYDIVLMDVQMPVMNGLEATRAVRKLESPKNQTRIIAMTASAMKAEVERCFAAGMDDFVAKPFNTIELLKKMSRLIQRMKVVA